VSARVDGSQPLLRSGDSGWLLTLILTVLKAAHRGAGDMSNLGVAGPAAACSAWRPHRQY
jgi:hypothetical protein